MTSVHVADVINASQVEDMVDSIVQEWVSIDIFVNNTGGLQTRKAQLWDL
jgi:NADP-dependent 3-hydroxy acid dehydrogenase YdfG